MKFRSFLAPHLTSYLEFRRKLGYTSFAEYAGYRAKVWDDYAVHRGIRRLQQIDERFLLDCIHARPHRVAATRNRLLQFARGFFNYLIRMGAMQTNPALRIRELKTQPYKPYIYPLKEIHQLIEQARRHQCPKATTCLLGPTMATLILLLYACGLRLGEAMNLKIEDVDFEENTLSLWKTKFHKERLVPFSEPTARKLNIFLDLRRKKFPNARPQDPYFCHRGGQRYANHSIEMRFRELLAQCGLAKPKGRGAPRLHDLRHSFAVHRLYKWYQEGHDILNKLPLLSTYMGHVNIENTQVYLTVTQALLREGDRRFQEGFEEIVRKSSRHLRWAFLPRRP